MRSRFLLQTPYAYTKQILNHRLYRSVINEVEIQFNDRWLAFFPPSNWTRAKELEPVLHRPSENAVTTIFAFYDYGSERASAGLEEAEQARGPAVSVEEIPALLRFPAGAVRHRQVLIFDPENGDVGRLAAALIADPVVIIAKDAEHEELLLKSGFSGRGRYLARLDTFPSIEKAREIVAKDFASYSPLYYTADQRQNLVVWLAGLLERYNIPDSILSLDGAQDKLKSLEALRAA